MKKLHAEVNAGRQIGPEAPVVVEAQALGEAGEGIEEGETGALVLVVHEAAATGGADGHVKEENSAIEKETVLRPETPAGEALEGGGV